MHISPIGCQAFATVIPVLLLAGFLSRRMLMMLVLRHAFVKIVWTLYIVYALVGMFVALVGASGDGIDGGLAWLVVASTLFAAGVAVIEAAVTMFQFDTPLTEQELCFMLGRCRVSAEEQSPDEPPGDEHADTDTTDAD